MKTKIVPGFVVTIVISIVAISAVSGFGQSNGCVCRADTSATTISVPEKIQSLAKYQALEDFRRARNLDEAIATRLKRIHNDYASDYTLAYHAAWTQEWQRPEVIPIREHIVPQQMHAQPTYSQNDPEVGSDSTIAARFDFMHVKKPRPTLGSFPEGVFMGYAKEWNRLEREAPWDERTWFAIVDVTGKIHRHVVDYKNHKVVVFPLAP